MESQLQRLEEKQNVLAEFCSTGGEIEFFIAWFTGERNTGEIFGWELLNRLAALRINFDFDVYGGKDPGEKIVEVEDSNKTSKE